MKHLIIPALILLTSCTAIEEGKVKPPLVYRIDIQQGNVVEQEMVAKLKVGMDEKQVKFIMGTPMLVDPFHTDRWEYIFSYQIGAKRREQRHVTLHFDDEKKLKGISGDIAVTHLPIQIDERKSEKSVVVPEGYNDDTLFEKFMPNFGDDKPQKKRKKKRDDEYEFDNTLELAEDEEEPVRENEIEDDIEAALEQSDSQGGVSEAELAEEMELAKELMAEDAMPAEENSAAEQKDDTDDDEPGFFGRMWDKITSDEETE